MRAIYLDVFTNTITKRACRLGQISFIKQHLVSVVFSELRENLTWLGANLKQSLLESARKTWESIHEFARGHSSTESEDRVEIAEEEKEDGAREGTCVFRNI